MYDFPWFIWLETKQGFQFLDERLIAKHITNYRNLNEKAREKTLYRFLDECELVVDAKASLYLPNARYRYRNDMSIKQDFSDEEIAQAIHVFLSLTELFESARTNYMLVSYVLAGLHSSSIRRAAPDVRFAVSIPGRSDEVAHIFSTITEAIVNKHRWKGKHCKLKREAVLKCQSFSTYIGKHLQDFSSIRIKAPKTASSNRETLCVPAKYVDTVVTILGADSGFLREAEPYMVNACVFLVGCSKSDWSTMRISSNDIARYDPTILRTVKEGSAAIAAMLRKWWSYFDAENRWAAELVMQSRASFGKPDSRYISVTIDPKKLRNAIAYRVFLSFLQFTVEQEWLSENEVSPYQLAAKAVFDPEPVENKSVHRMEQPETFLTLMRRLVEEHADDIVPPEECFEKSRHHLGAIRSINKIKYLVMPEESWKK